MEYKSTSKVGFVVDTFHELVAKLKEKEKELEVLKKIAEQRAEDVESYNKNILQSVPSGVISFDNGLKIKSINIAAQKILLLRSEDVIDKSYNEFLIQPITNLIKESSFIERADVQYKISTGRTLRLGLTYSPLLDNAEKKIGSILVFTDLTELKALESQAELRKRLSNLGEMSAGIAHEIRNPLGVIAGYAKLLSRKLDPALLPTVDAITKEIEIMDRIILDFLSFAKPIEVVPTKINLYEMISSCFFHISTDKKNIDATIDIDKLLNISGDEVLLRQAFTNLIQNAAESMKNGGRLAFRYAQQDKYAEIEISDTGHGIPEGIKDKIFLPFYTTKEKGTGLGLAIVHKIIISHGGTISVESAETGTTFRLKLPIT
ncbi:MAG: PAS domain-containing protein [Nitrospiraceae bacterium]|nr:PAS domain-containing protein [Nitrospiraceae bacterium]